ncbi:MAG TPA: hypothetical protein VGK95_12020 [Caldimonas sp.]|jgi:hypothetical protein
MTRDDVAPGVAQSGVLEKCAKLAGPAHLGAMTHSGPAAAAGAADER